mgnify:CR=1 FL=1
MRTNSLTQFYLSIICDLTSCREIFRCLRNNIQHTQFSKEVLLLVYWPESTSQRRDGLWTGLLKVAVTWRLLRVISLFTPFLLPPPESQSIRYDFNNKELEKVVVKIHNKAFFLFFNYFTFHCNVYYVYTYTFPFACTRASSVTRTRVILSSEKACGNSKPCLRWWHTCFDLGQ